MIRKTLMSIIMVLLLAGTAMAIPTCDFKTENGKIQGWAPFGTNFVGTTTVKNPTVWEWYFKPASFTGGDNSDYQSYHPVTALHTFKEAGTYTVRLTVMPKTGGYDGSALKEKFAYIRAYNCDYMPYDIIFPKHPYTVDFWYAGERAGTLSNFKWNFGDGTTATYKTQETCKHTYKKAGKYTTSLTVADSKLGTHTTTKKNSIVVM